tara:strand:- start:1224 stop:1619 length:396 start_codon:yes stop_codon:yes gene_type:complete
MILDKLIEFCGRPENAQAFRVNELEHYICYYFTNGLWAQVHKDGEINGVAFARMVETIEDRSFYWLPNQKEGRYLVIDSVVARGAESKKSLWKSLIYVIEHKRPKRIFIMRHGKWKELTKDILRRMKWERE